MGAGVNLSGITRGETGGAGLEQEREREREKGEGRRMS